LLALTLHDLAGPQLLLLLLLNGSLLWHLLVRLVSALELGSGRLLLFLDLVELLLLLDLLLLPLEFELLLLHLLMLLLLNLHLRLILVLCDLDSGLVLVFVFVLFVVLVLVFFLHSGLLLRSLPLLLLLGSLLHHQRRFLTFFF